MDHLLPAHLVPSSADVLQAPEPAQSSYLPSPPQLDYILRAIADHSAALVAVGRGNAQMGILRIKSMNPRDVRALVDVIAWFLRSCVRTSAWLVRRVNQLKAAVRTVQRSYRRYRLRKRLAVLRVIRLWEAAEQERQRQALAAEDRRVNSVRELEDDFYSGWVPREVKVQIVEGAYLEHLRLYHREYRLWFRAFCKARAELSRIHEMERQIREVASLHHSLMNAAQQRLVGEKTRQKLPDPPACTFNIAVDIPRFQSAAHALQRAAHTAKVRARLTAAAAADAVPGSPGAAAPAALVPLRLHTSHSRRALLRAGGEARPASPVVQLADLPPPLSPAAREPSSPSPTPPHSGKGPAPGPADVPVEPRPLPEVASRRALLTPLSSSVCGPPGTPASWDSRSLARVASTRALPVRSLNVSEEFFTPPPRSLGLQSLQPLRRGSSKSLPASRRASSSPPVPAPYPERESAKAEATRALAKPPATMLLPGAGCYLTNMASSLLPRRAPSPLRPSP